MKSEPQTGCVSRSADSKLRLGVDLSNSPHMRASLGAREVIAQDVSFLSYGTVYDTKEPAVPIGDRDVR
jgi:hypothetical protein